MRPPDGAELEALTPSGALRCQQYKNDGSGQCGSPAVSGYHNCKWHGGKTKRQVTREMSRRDKSAIAEGRYHKNMPKEIVNSYARSLADPDLLNLTNEIALIDSRTSELIETLKDVPSPDYPALLKRLDKLIRDCDDEYLLSELETLREGFAGGHARDSAWDKITDAIKTRVTIADAERKRRSDMQGYLTSKQVMQLAGQLIDMATQRITDADSMRAFAKDIKRVTGGHFVTGGQPSDQAIEVLYEDKAKEHIEHRKRELNTGRD